MKPETELLVQALHEALKSGDEVMIKKSLHLFVIGAHDVYSVILRARFKELHSEIMTCFGKQFSQQAYSYVNGIQERPVCKNCDRHVAWAKKYSKGYSTYCSMSCMNKCESHKECIRAGNLSRGKAANGFTEETKAVIRETNLAKFGDVSFFKTKHFKDALKKTSLERYGVQHPMQDRAIAEKAGGYKRYVHNIKGKEYKTQGYEHIAIQFLLDNGCEHTDIKTGSDVPSFRYLIGGIWRVYHPDVFIPKWNLIVEVKSDWTMKSEISKNLHKHHAVICRDRNCAFVICDHGEVLHFVVNEEVETLGEEYLRQVREAGHLI